MSADSRLNALSVTSSCQTGAGMSEPEEGPHSLVFASPASWQEEAYKAWFFLLLRVLGQLPYPL